MANKIASKSLKTLERRHIIIDKTLALIAQKGIDGVSIAEIAKATSLGHGQIYRCFQDKNEILKQVIQQVTQKRLILFHLGNHDIHKKAKEISTIYQSDLTNDEVRLIYELMKLNQQHPLFVYAQEADDSLTEFGLQMLRFKYPQATEAQIVALSEIVAIFTEGSLLRRLHGFSSRADIERLEQMFVVCLNALDEMLDVPQHSSSATTGHESNFR
ncbi:TetR family transcriptional regulator [Acinetobacter soli]|uniref:TetR/AcrR family transcriptional regulator n=1 Tax=Acinetobacter soli TaxID=487316 RepID=UPI0032B5C291